jgi:hypothetical protein
MKTIYDLMAMDERTGTNHTIRLTEDIRHTLKRKKDYTVDWKPGISN